MMRRPAPLLLLCLVSLLGACGVDTGGGVETVDPDGVPFGLLEEDREPIAGPPPGAGAVVDLYLFDPDEERVVPVTRRVDATGIAAMVAELEAGPSDAESSLGLQSALTDVEPIAGIEVDGDTVVLDLAESFTELSGSEQTTAIAQLVFTLTQRRDVDRVGITAEGEPIEVPRGDGTLTRDTLDRSDYESLAPP